MKLLKTTILSAALTTFASFAFGQTDVNITGSTAYRANTYRAIQASLNAGYTLAYSGTGTAGQSTLEGSQFAIFVGTLKSTSASVRIKTSFTGSEAGIQAVGRGTLIPFYPDGQATSAFPGTNSSGTPANTEVATIDMADTEQAASNFLGRYKGFNYPALTENSNSPVGVVPFKFYTQFTGLPSDVYSRITNITSQQARLLYTTGGTAPASFFTGNSGDNGVTVYATGRDPDSGTRVTMFAETGIGSKSVCNSNQAPEDAANNIITTAGGAIDHFAQYPAGTVNGIAVAAGDNGYNSGGKLAAALNNTTPANTVFVGYASTNDGDGQLNTRAGHAGNGTKELAYNGVVLGGGTTSSYDYNTNTNLTYGAYTYWGYEHMYMGSGATGDILQAANDIAGDLKSNDALVFLNSMHVSRAGFTTGGTVTP